MKPKNSHHMRADKGAMPLLKGIFFYFYFCKLQLLQAKNKSQLKFKHHPGMDLENII